MNFYQHLAPEERYMIYQLRRCGQSIRSIARSINRCPSSVSREINRNSGLRGYRYKQAQHLCDARRATSHSRRRISPATLSLVREYLCRDWSPEQISNYLKEEHLTRISIETIYQLVWADKRAGGSLYRHLRQCRRKRRKRYGCRYKIRGQIKNRISIDQRPELVDTRSRVGDWEIDSMIGKRHKGALVTMVERASRFTLIAKVSHRQSADVCSATVEQLGAFKELVHTITTDNGKEFAEHAQISKKLDAAFYFAHPYCSWQRGLNENTNGLIRQYVPKSSSMEYIEKEQLIHIMRRLNNRPRKCLGYKSPLEVFQKAVTARNSTRQKEELRKMKESSVALTT